MSGRRISGEGTVYRRKDGRWEGAAYLGTINGKVRRLRVYGKTRAEANNKLTVRLADAQRGIPIPDQSWTVGTYLDYWLRDIAPTTRRPKTMEQYSATIRLYLKPMVGSYALDRLTVATLQQILNQALVDGKTIRTVRLIRTVLSAALTRAMREELVTRNVARLVELEQAPRKEITPWTAEEGSRFLSYAQSHPLYPAFLMLGVYGLRRGEVLGLRWQDIDWDHNVIHIRQQLQQIGNHLEVGPVKTIAGQRDLPLLDVVRQALRQYQEHAQRGALPDEVANADGVPGDIQVLDSHGGSSFNHDAVATRLSDEEIADIIIRGRNGMPLWPRNFVRAFHLLCEKAGVRRIKLHHLRHGAATLMKDTGAPARDAQLILGHSHISTTQQIYQHADLPTQQVALDRVGRMLMDAFDGSRSRQTQPSSVEIVAESATEILPKKKVDLSFSRLLSMEGPVGLEPTTPCLKVIPRLVKDPSLTSVIGQLRTHIRVHVIGSVAVNLAVNPDQLNCVVWEWIPLRTALTPITIPFLNQRR
ncbi:tyrosine-type recombinase/integrase [Nocardia sp. CA-119907]|uniref:tyrosine-type recombinase/integrase n=1 Tax=Nocardia sp. CA-119907 TaxID=3239973 RepID=UPI003D95B17D